MAEERQVHSVCDLSVHDAVYSEPETLLAALRHAASVMFNGSPVFLAYAFGSRIWGRPQPASDLDVGYYVSPSSQPRCLELPLELDLAGRLSDAIGIEVDLRCLGVMPLGLRGRVLAEGWRIYCSDEAARVNLERDLLARYLDYKPKLDALRQLRFAALAEKIKETGW